MQFPTFNLCFPLLSVMWLILACNNNHTTSKKNQEVSVASSSGNDVNLTITDTEKNQEINETRQISVQDSVLITPSELLGQFEPASHPDFIKIADHLTEKKGIFMRKKAYEAFVKMHKKAAEAGVNLKIVSATRNFNYQKGIWERKFFGETLVNGTNLAEKYRFPLDRATVILKYSSMPGTSRHHWGTDIDLNQLTNDWFEKAEGKKLYDWLTAHAAEFGFCQPYSQKGTERPNGYEEEKWHWSYLPLSGAYMEAYRALIKPGDITGFAGSEVAKELKVIDHYVLGISSSCYTKK